LAALTKPRQKQKSAYVKWNFSNTIKVSSPPWIAAGLARAAAIQILEESPMVKKHSKPQPKKSRGTVDKGVGRGSRKHGIPPTTNLKKFPDEAYGDIEIPHRRGQK
jgi:hypothetical protein